MAFPANGSNVRQLKLGGPSVPLRLTRPLNTTELLAGFAALVVLLVQNTLLTADPPIVGQPLCNLLPELYTFQLLDSSVSTLPPGFFGSSCASLTTVSIQTVQLTALPPRLFNNMPSLEALTISGTPLTWLPSPLLTRTSAAAVSLLTLTNNQLTTISPNLTEGGMPGLEQLDLSGNNLTALPPHLLGNSPQLTMLKVAYNPKLADIPSSVLAPGVSLEIFSASNCSLSSVPASVLASPTLNSLSLASNRLTCFGAPPAAGAQLPTELELVDVSDNLITTLDAGLFRSSAASLRTISMTFNRISALPPGLLTNMSVLSTLDLRHNLLTSLPSPDFLLGCWALTQFKVAHNLLTSIPPLFRFASPAPLASSSTTAVPTTTSAAHPSNPSSNLENSFTQLSIIDISNNLLTAIPEAFLRESPSTPAPALLVQLVASNNNISSLPTSLFADIRYIQLVDLKNNLLTQVPRFTNVPSLSSILLQNNRIRQIHVPGAPPILTVPSTVAAPSYSLALDNNLITSLDGISAFLTPQCTFLSLSGNPITSIPANAFVTLTGIQQLSLSRTLITALVPGALNGLNSLQSLNISSTPLSTIAPSSFGSAFAQASSSFNPYTQPGQPPSGLYLTNTNLSHTLREEMFLLLPDLVTTVLGGAYDGPEHVPSAFTSNDQVEAAAAELARQPPASVSRQPLVLDSCCGLEWLAAKASRFNFFFEPSSIRCRLRSSSPFPPVLASITPPSFSALAADGNFSRYHQQKLTYEGYPWPLPAGAPQNISVPFLPALRDLVICPCLPPVIVLSPWSSVGCSNIGSSAMLLDGVCNNPFNFATCPSGTVLRPLFPTRRAVACVTVDADGTTLDQQPGMEGMVVESVCAPCLVEGCLVCATSQAICSVCDSAAGLILLSTENTCVQSCPTGFYASFDTVAGFGTQCQPCIDSNCAVCTGATGDVCDQCSAGLVLFEGRCFSGCPQLYGLTAGSVCEPCKVPSCSVCTNNTALCTSCLEPLALYNNRCLSKCPSGTLRTKADGVTVCSVIPPGSAIGDEGGGGLSGAHLAIVIAGSVLLVVIVLGLVVVKMRGRFGVIESDLRERLLSSEEEVLALRQVWQIAPEEVELVRRIDTDSPGAFGEVWLAKMNGSTDVAVKKLQAAQLELNSEAQLEFEQEVAFMQTIRHANLVAFLGAGEFPDGQPFLVLEYMARGSLRKMLAESPEIAWRHKVRFCHDIVLGMRHLHSLGRIHRDCKSDNVLVAADFRAKVADFGQSRILQRRATVTTRNMGGRAWPPPSPAAGGADPTLTTNVGTPLWMAPEMLASEAYNNKVDVWSMGIVFWEVLCQQLPWGELESGRGSFLGTLLTAIESGQRPHIPDDTPASYRKLVEDCWQLDPAMRPSFEELAKYEVFNEGKY